MSAAAATTQPVAAEANNDKGKVMKDRLLKLQESVRTGGKGSVRRKKKAVHKVNATDDKRLQTTLKRLGVNAIPGIEEVNLFKDDGNVIQFKNPKVQASITANTYAVSGTPSDKKMEELVPEMLQNFNPEQLNNLKQMLAQQGVTGEKPASTTTDDDVPALVGTFEDVAKGATPSVTETKPAETKPAETTKPVETKSAETTKPVEIKPAETTKPVETTKPAEIKPAETTKPVETPKSAVSTTPAEVKK